MGSIKACSIARTRVRSFLVRSRYADAGTCRGNLGRMFGDPSFTRYGAGCDQSTAADDEATQEQVHDFVFGEAAGVWVDVESAEGTVIPAFG